MTDEQGARSDLGHPRLAPDPLLPPPLNPAFYLFDPPVRTFILRYMPAYELWLPGVRQPTQRWAGKALEVRLGAGREVEGVGLF